MTIRQGVSAALAFAPLLLAAAAHGKTAPNRLRNIPGAAW